MIHVEIITTYAVEITQYALKGQKPLAQGNTLGKPAMIHAPCKGKSFIPPIRKKQEPAIKLFLAFFDFMLQLLGDYYLLVGILNSLTLEMDLPS